MKTFWMKRLGISFGDFDGVQHTSEKTEDDGILRKRRSVVLVGKVESNYPVCSFMYVFFFFRIWIVKKRIEDKG